jgi:uncharacterized OB-fold protein
MKHPTPNPGGTSAEYWKAAAEGRLALPYCAACVQFHWPVRAACPACGAAFSWRDASGRGAISSWSVVHRAVNPELKDAAPYIVAFVELDEGVRLFTNIVDARPDSMRAGLRVHVRFEAALDAALQIPVFAVDASQRSEDPPRADDPQQRAVE